jgi:hypothetical protein
LAISFLDSSDSEEEPLVVSFEHGNEPLGPMKDGELIDQLNDYYTSRMTLHPRLSLSAKEPCVDRLLCLFIQY